MLGKRCRDVSSDVEAAPGKKATASLDTAVQLRVGACTYLPVSKRLKSLLEEYTEPLKPAEAASGGCFSLIPCELIPAVAQHLDSKQDLVHFSLTNKGMYSMLLPALHTVRSDQAQACMEDLAAAFQQCLDLPQKLTQDLQQKYPQFTEFLQVTLQAVKDDQASAEGSIASGMRHLQEMFQGCQKSLAALLDHSDPSLRWLSTQEKHVLVLHMHIVKKGVSPSQHLHHKVFDAAAMIRELLQAVTDRHQSYFAKIETFVAAQAENLPGVG